MLLLPSLEALGNNKELGNVLFKLAKRRVWILLEMLRRFTDVCVSVQNTLHSSQYYTIESFRDAPSVAIAVLLQVR